MKGPQDVHPTLARCPRLPEGDLWIFGYGSLMWNPDFPYAESSPALVRGYHREFCISSHRYRGTQESPGLVLGLDRGGACRGIAFRVRAHDVPRIMPSLWEREMSRGTYMPRFLSTELPCARVRSLAFVADREHSSYAGPLPVDEIARRIATCRGSRGPNFDYLENTLKHLEALGVRDHHLTAVYRAIAPHRSG